MCLFYYCLSFISPQISPCVENPLTAPPAGGKKSEFYTRISNLSRKIYLQFTVRGCLFISPGKARGGGRSIRSRYLWCYSGYLFLNPEATDIPPIGKGMVGVSQYSLPTLVTAALINQGSYCSSWVHLYKTNCNTILPSATEQIYEATGRPNNQFPDFLSEVFFQMLI